MLTCDAAEVESNIMELPQIAAVVKDSHGAQAISLPTWYLWCVSHVFTALYALTINVDLLMAGITGHAPEEGTK